MLISLSTVHHYLRDDVSKYRTRSGIAGDARHQTRNGRLIFFYFARQHEFHLLVCDRRWTRSLISVPASTVQPQFEYGGPRLGVLRSAQRANGHEGNIRNRALEKPAVQTQSNSSPASVVEDPAKAVTRMDPRPYEGAPNRYPTLLSSSFLLLFAMYRYRYLVSESQV